MFFSSSTTKTDTEKQVDDIQTKIDEYQGSIDSLNDKLDRVIGLLQNFKF